MLEGLSDSHTELGFTDISTDTRFHKPKDPASICSYTFRRFNGFYDHERQSREKKEGLAEQQRGWKAMENCRGGERCLREGKKSVE